MAELTAAQRIRQSNAKREKTIVDVHVPSGETYKFEKPSKFTTLFALGELPQFAASGAVTKWTEDGIMKGLESGQADTLKLAQAAFSVRDKVLALSYSPKIVMGAADPEKDELSADEIPDEDLDYLFKWVQAGGNESLMLGTFPGESQSRPLASAGGSKRGNKAKSASGAK